MPLFNYIAIDKEGKQKEGTLEVGSQNEAISRIKEMGYYPTQVAEVKDTPEEFKKRKKKSKKGEISIALPFVSSKELCQFTRQLAVLIDAGLPLMRGMTTLQNRLRIRTSPALLATLAIPLAGDPPSPRHWPNILKFLTSCL